MRLWRTASLTTAVFLTALLSARAEIPTQEQRARDSSFNEEYQTSWRCSYLQLSDGNGVGKRLTACYRKEITLTAAPRDAKLTFFNKSMKPYWIAVNGQAVAQPVEGGLQLTWIKNLDVTGQLRTGRNLISFQGECQRAEDSWLAVEGMVFCEDGSSLRILTDGWTGGWNLADGWDRPKAAMLVPVTPGEKPLRGTAEDVPLRPYYGPIQVEAIGANGKPLREPIFDEESRAVLDITLVNIRATDRSATSLSAELFDEFTRKNVWKRAVSLAPRDTFDSGGRLDLGALPKGAYRVRLVLTQGSREIDRRDYEVASVGLIRQRVVEGKSYEEGLDLEEVWSVDCTAPTSPETFVAAEDEWRKKVDPSTSQQVPWQEVATKVVEGPAGRYRTLADNRGRYFFGYQYKLQRLFVPHLAVVEWPDDARRSFICHIDEPGTGVPPGRPSSHLTTGWQRSESAVVMDHDLMPRRTNRMQKLHLLFWPNSPVGSIQICNVRENGSTSEAPAAAARITIYEITNDLPALKVADAGDRWIGPHTERGPYTLASTYYAGPLGSYFAQQLGSRDHPEYYRNWYTATENWIKRARFSGQNLYVLGHFMYRSTLYPSKMSELGYSQNNYGGGDWVRDYTGLVLRMLERNGMVMLSGVEHFSVDGFTENQPTPAQIAVGVEHPFVVSRDGRLFPVHATHRADGSWGGSGAPRADGYVRWPAMNYFHPEIQERFLGIVGELSDRYGQYPGGRASP